jgi:hypothetical protein
MLANGVEPGRAAQVLRYTPARVSVLQTDPSFQQMVKYYETVRDEEFRASAEKLADLTETVIDELQERLETDAAGFTNGQLSELLKTAADRTGLGPTSTQRHIHVALTQDALDAIKQRVSSGAGGTVELVSEFKGEGMAQPSSDAGGGTKAIEGTVDNTATSRSVISKEGNVTVVEFNPTGRDS